MVRSESWRKADVATGIGRWLRDKSTGIMELTNVIPVAIEANTPFRFGKGGIVALIPALNEEEAIAYVLDEIPSGSVDQVLVIDNGSTDATAKVARQRGAWVVSEPRRGYGSAMLRGLAEAKRIAPNVEIFVFLDGDHSDYPEQIPQLLAPILENRADFVLASRQLIDRRVLPAQSRWGNGLACRLLWLFTGVRFTDLAPFRAIRADCLDQLEMQDRDYGWTVEMQIKAARSGLRIQEIAAKYRPRIGVSKITGTVRGCVLAGQKILWTLFRYGFWRPRRHAKPMRVVK